MNYHQNLKLLKNFIPFQSLKAKKIRGNIQTRLSKIITNKSEDGLFMSKAAIDRVFKYGQKINNKEFVRFKKSLAEFTSVILPLSQFPSAAAQGCVAIEFRTNDKNLKKILEKVNHLESYENCLRERNFLARWGGGCSLDIGVSIDNVLNKKILFSRGRDNTSNKYFHDKEYLFKEKTIKVKNIFPNNLKKYHMFERTEISSAVNLAKKIIIVSRANSISKKMFKDASYIIASGSSTWQKLNKIGVLVNASLDNFGESYRFPNIHFTQSSQKPYKLTYIENKLESQFKKIPHYSLSPSVNRITIDELFIAESFYWMSFSAFNLAIKLRPEINEDDFSEQLQEKLGAQYKVQTKAQLNELFYKVINTENFVSYLIFTLIVIIAMFTIVGAIIMMIIDKKKNLKTLLSLGATMPEIKNIFVLQGFLLTNRYFLKTSVFITTLSKILKNNLAKI